MILNDRGFNILQFYQKSAPLVHEIRDRVTQLNELDGCPLAGFTVGFWMAYVQIPDLWQEPGI